MTKSFATNFMKEDLKIFDYGIHLEVDNQRNVKNVTEFSFPTKL